VPDRLSISPDGLRTAAAALNEHAGQIGDANCAEPAGRKPSSVGAARVSAAIAALTHAYAGRLANHGRSTAAAATSYDATDDDGAAAIGTVSV
jgi:hypothetical protein